MNLTDEQREIIEDTIKNNKGKYSILSCAGSGKSFTIFKAIDYIKEHEPNAKILYCVFNKQNQLEAEHKLRKYDCWLVPVEVRTAHSYALEKWKNVRKKVEVISTLDKDIIHDIQIKSYIYDIKYSKHAPFKWLQAKYESSRQSLKVFCENMVEHFNDFYEGADKPKDCDVIGKNGKKYSKFGIPVDEYSVVTAKHIDVFEMIVQEHEKQGKYTHGMYMKAAAYSNKTGGSHYDYVFFDEAQDANFFMYKLLMKQDIDKFYFIGDTRQSIYDFDDSNINVFDDLTFDKQYTLSRSFRFGKAVAHIANIILDGHGLHVEGTEQKHGVDTTKCTRLYRTNAKLFKDALDLAYQARRNNILIKIDLLRSDIDEIQYNEMLSFLGLFYKYVKPRLYRDYERALISIPMSASLKTFAQKLKDDPRFYNVYNEMYDTLSDDIHSIYNYAKNDETFIDKFRAFKDCRMCLSPIYTITMCTMHRSKGLEWDNVVIAEPTRLYYEDKQGSMRKNSNPTQELNLAYVACTRARKSLDASIFKEELMQANILLNENETFQVKDGVEVVEVTV